MFVFSTNSIRFLLEIPRRPNHYIVGSCHVNKIRRYFVSQTSLINDWKVTVQNMPSNEGTFDTPMWCHSMKICYLC